MVVVVSEASQCDAPALGGIKSSGEDLKGEAPEDSQYGARKSWSFFWDIYKSKIRDEFLRELDEVAGGAPEGEAPKGEALVIKTILQEKMQIRRELEQMRREMEQMRREMEQMRKGDGADAEGDGADAEGGAEGTAANPLEIIMRQGSLLCSAPFLPTTDERS